MIPRSSPLVEDDFLRTVSNNAVDSGRRSFEFQALETGTHRLEFSKRMAWKFTAEDRRVFEVTVLDPVLQSNVTCQISGISMVDSPR